MRYVSAHTTAAWLAPDKTGDNAPMARATIQALSMKTIAYDYNNLRGVVRRGVGKFSTAMFGQAHTPIELPNIRSVSSSRGVDADAGTCTLTLWNCELLPMGTAPDDPNYFEREGWFTPNYGAEAQAQTRWNITTNDWQNILVPDRVIRTYKGYGSDFSVPAELDTFLYPSGVWIIDDVEFTHDGLITVQCRDMGRLLLEQISFPPVVPQTDYPLVWDPYHEVDNPDIVTTSTVWSWPTYETDSNMPWVGRGIKNGNDPYVDRVGGVKGHYGTHAFDYSGSTYWLSAGAEDATLATEYIQGGFSPQSVQAIRVKAWGGPYKLYISVWFDGAWQGAHIIPDVHKKIGDTKIVTGSDIRYIMTTSIAKNENKTITLPATYANAERVRVTFSGLYNSGSGKYKYRAGCYDLQVGSAVTGSLDGGTHTEGNYSDMSDIVKWILAWGGFYWPDISSGQAYQTYSDASRVTIAPPEPDSAFPSGRVWGDIENTGTSTLTKLSPELFDKKPLMDGISYIREQVNYLFMVDETGGAVWRSPNIWQLGNYLSGSDGGPNVGRVADTVEIDERTTLISYRARLSGRSLREVNFVAEPSGQIGATSRGFNPNPSGMRRALLYIDQGFTTAEECQIMADLISVRQSYTYRVGSLTMAANPSIQVDDQVRIWERTTGESYLHYVRSISSDLDIATGRWTYSLETHWLGTDPFTDWVVDPTQLSDVTQEYLKAIGATS